MNKLHVLRQFLFAILKYSYIMKMKTKKAWGIDVPDAV
jgi:hypothetical protein